MQGALGLIPELAELRSVVPRGWKQDGQEFKVIHSNIANLRPVWATWDSIEKGGREGKGTPLISALRRQWQGDSVTSRPAKAAQ